MEISQDAKLSQKARQYEETKSEFKALSEQLKEELESQTDYEDMILARKKAKELKEYIYNEESVKKILEKQKLLRERMELLKEMIRIEMIEQQVVLFDEFDGKGSFKQSIKAEYKPKRDK